MAIKMLSVVDYLLKYGSSGVIDDFKYNIILFETFLYVPYEDEKLA
jgi:hypothetical protein